MPFNGRKGKKRTSDVDEPDISDRPAKKLFSIFDKLGESSNDASNLRPAFRWLSLPDNLQVGVPVDTCLYGEHLEPPVGSKVAALDLDGTIIIGGRPMNKNGAAALAWKWWHRIVPKKLKELHEEGYSIVVISNQCLAKSQLESWKKKVVKIAEACDGVPFRIFAATQKDCFRKPNPGMWFALQKMFKDSQNVDIDMENSFFVGDAAGRKSDHAGTDRKFAENLGLQFYTPEEYFLKLGPGDYTLEGFHVRNLQPPPSDILPAINNKNGTVEMVLLLGPQAVGKTTLYERHFKPAGYELVGSNLTNQRLRDENCKRIVQCVNAGISIVLEDSTGMKEYRQPIIEVAKELEIPVRCVVFEEPYELACHYNMYRTFCRPWIPFLESLESVASNKGDGEESTETPDSINTTNPATSKAQVKPPFKPAEHQAFRRLFKRPQLSEGFSEITSASLSFQGNDIERRLWNMWLHVSGR